jgi:hypothetical protein
LLNGLSGQNASKEDADRKLGSSILYADQEMCGGIERAWDMFCRFKTEQDVTLCPFRCMYRIWHIDAHIILGIYMLFVSGDLEMSRYSD